MLSDVEEFRGFLLRCGIDHFKEINENRGMDYGDTILRRTVECIKEVIEPEQKLYCIMADEFVIIDFSAKSVDNAKELYKKIRRNIDKFIAQNSYEVFYTVSAGILAFESV